MGLYVFNWPISCLEDWKDISKADVIIIIVIIDIIIIIIVQTYLTTLKS